MICVGTSGYSYDDWVGPYYPPGTAKNRFLEHYAADFDCCEINFTYYAMPSARTMRSMAERTGPDFRFSVKATGDMTHSREKATPELFTRYREGIAPLIEAGKLTCILAQFPSSFKPTGESRRFLEYLREQLTGLEVVVEFRNRQWERDEVFRFLRDHGFGYCCVDQPHLRGLMTARALATSPVGYVRFHGRNWQKWWAHEEAWERYNYLYSADELREWLPKLEELREQGAKQVLVFFNNHYQAQAVQNAQMFLELLREEGPPAPSAP